MWKRLISKKVKTIQNSKRKEAASTWKKWHVNNIDCTTAWLRIRVRQRLEDVFRDEIVRCFHALQHIIHWPSFFHDKSIVRIPDTHRPLRQRKLQYGVVSEVLQSGLWTEFQGTRKWRPWLWKTPRNYWTSVRLASKTRLQCMVVVRRKTQVD